MEAEIIVKQRCLLCRSEIPGEVKTEEGSSTASVLSKHLRVIFLLRKVLQVPVPMLARFLASCPNVDGWVGVCERCQGLVRECRQVHRQILELKRRWVECRLLVVRVVKETVADSGMENVEDVGLLDIDKEIRAFVENHEFSTWQNPFIKGDLMAEQKQACNLDHEYFHETSEDFVAFEDNDPLEENIVEMDDNDNTYMDYNEEATNDNIPNDIPVDIPVPAKPSNEMTFEEEEENEEELVKDDDKEKDDDWRVGDPLNKMKKKRKKKKLKEGLVPKPKSEPKRPPFEFVDMLPKLIRKQPSEGPKFTVCTKELMETVYFKKKSVDEFISIIETRQETPFNADQKLVIKKCVSQHISRYRTEARKRKFTRKVLLSSLGDFVVKFPVKEPTPPPVEVVQQNKVGRPRTKLPEDGSYQTKCYVSGCFQTCRTLEELQAHQSRNHTEKERNNVPETAKIYQCTKCFEVFRWRNSIKKHLGRVHNPQKKKKWTGIRVKCLVEGCSRIWLSMRSLLQHQETEHSAKELESIPKDAPIHECKDCKEMFSNNDKLKHHRQRIHGEGPLPQMKAICDICGAALRTPGQVQSHKIKSIKCRLLQGLEEPEKTLVCQHCGKKFHYQGTLSHHIRSVHEPTFTEQCDVCGKGCYGKKKLAKHKAIAHKIGDFPCTEVGCQRVFWRQIDLDFHVGYVHRGDGGYFCEVKECGRRFQTKHHLTNHMNQNHLKGEPQYKCKECGKPFYFSEYLCQHMYLVHRGQKKKRRPGKRGQGSSAVIMTTTIPTYAVPANTNEAWKLEEHAQQPQPDVNVIANDMTIL